MKKIFIILLITSVLLPSIPAIPVMAGLTNITEYVDVDFEDAVQRVDDTNTVDYDETKIIDVTNKVNTSKLQWISTPNGASTNRYVVQSTDSLTSTGSPYSGVCNGKFVAPNAWKSQLAFEFTMPPVTSSGDALVYVDMRVRRWNTGDEGATILLTDSDAKNILKISFPVSTATPPSLVADATYSDVAYPATAGWRYVRAVLNFTTKTFELYQGDSLSTLTDFVNGKKTINFMTSTAKDFSVMKSNAANFNERKGSLGFDDIRVYTAIDASAYKPEVKDVDISGNFTVGETLTGTYTLTDATETDSAFTWETSDDELFTTPALVSSGKTYIIQQSDYGKYIRFGVVPKAADGTTGSAVYKTSHRQIDSPEVSAMLDSMRGKWKTMLTGGDYDDTDPKLQQNITAITELAQENWSTMIKTSRTNALWSGESLGTSNSSNVNTAYERLLSMAVAHETKDSDLYEDDTLRADILDALDWLDEKGIYTNGMSMGSGNWWHYQIGIPLSLNDINVLLYDYISEVQRSKYMAAVKWFAELKRTGANRAWECEILTGIGIITKDRLLLEKAKGGMTAVFGMVDSGDGFYEDGSFIQHTFFPYAGGYGTSLLKSVSIILYLLDGSPWEITDPVKNHIYNWIPNAYAPFIYRGGIMDMVRGREISRAYSTPENTAHDIMNSIIRISRLAPEEYSKLYKSMIKYWINSNNAVPYLEGTTNYMILQASSIMNDSSITPINEPVFFKQYNNMDRTVQTRQSYAVGISMHSSRIANFEAINSENGSADHTGDGMLYLYNNDLTQFSGAFWPTVNISRLPGTTVLKDSEVAENQRNDRNWVGGTGLLGLYGAAGMDLHPYGQNLYAKKSWFMFDDEIVALGAGINSDDGITAETIVENRKLSSEFNNEFIVDGSSKPVSNGWSEKLTGTSWAHLQGNALENSDIGYYFPSGADINALREERTGSWRSRSTSATSPAGNFTEKYLTMWFDHGVNPDNDSYEYVLLPNKSSTDTEAYASSPDIDIIENSEYVQAVKEKKTNILGANFWTDTNKTVDILSCNKQASVMMKTTDGRLDVSVSDPTMKNTDMIDIEIAQSAKKVLSSDASIIIKQLYPTVKFSVYVDGAKGKSFNVSFDLTGDEPDFANGKDTYIIDNDDLGFTTDSPWTAISTTEDSYGRNFVHDNTTTADPNKWAMWMPDIIEADTYDVYIRWGTLTNAPSAAPVEIHHAEGDYTTYINQQTTAVNNAGKWTLLGSFPFDAGKNGYIKLLASCEGRTIADAVMLVAKNASGNAYPNTIFFAEPEWGAIHKKDYEDFDTGTFTVEDVLSGANIYKKLLKKNGETWLTAELSSTSDSFASANPAYNETLIAKDTGTASKTVNPTQYFSTAPGRMTRASGAEDIRLYHNFHDKLSTTGAENTVDPKGLIVVDLRVKKPTTEYVDIVLSEDAVSSYSSTGRTVMSVKYKTARGDGLAYLQSSSVSVYSQKFYNASEWLYLRFVVDLKNQKVKLYTGETLDSMRPWEGAGVDNTYNFYNNLTDINGIASIYFKGKGTLELDDLNVYCVPYKSIPQLKNIRIEQGKITGVGLTHTNDLPKTVPLMVAQYNGQDQLEDIKIIDVTVAREILFNTPVDYIDGCTVKILMWEMKSASPLALSTIQ